MNKDALTRHLISSGVLSSPHIIAAFKKINRADFAPKQFGEDVYGDFPLPIGKGQTISQPTTVMFMLELLEPKAEDKILDVGSGSGWTTALLAQIVGEEGEVWGVEIVRELVAMGKRNLAKYHLPQAKIVPSGKKFGLPDKAPFDKILVSAAAAKDIPQELVDQLKPGGRLVIPVQNSIFQIDKMRKGEIQKMEFPGFVFVPLIKK